MKSKHKLWDEEKFQAQQAYMERLQRLPLKELKRLHREVFTGMKAAFNVRIPPWCPRVVWERRLFLLFAAKNYHLPKNNPETKRFMKQVKDVLTCKFAGHLDSIDKQVKRALNKHSNFTSRQIKSMDEETVSRYLIKLGYEWEEGDLTLEQLRQLLWEYFNLPAAETWPTRVNRDGQVRKLVKPKDFGSPKLRNVILENPEMGWSEFCMRFGDQMPSVTHGSFRTTRWELKKAGFDLPSLKRGPAKGAKWSESRRDHYEQRNLHRKTRKTAKAVGEDEDG